MKRSFSVFIGKDDGSTMPGKKRIKVAEVSSCDELAKAIVSGCCLAELGRHTLTWHDESFGEDLDLTKDVEFGELPDNLRLTLHVLSRWVVYCGVLALLFIILELQTNLLLVFSAPTSIQIHRRM